MTSAELLEAGVRVIGYDPRVGRSPTAGDADADCGICLQILYVSGVGSLLGDNPADGAFEVEADDVGSASASASAVGLDEHVAGDEP